MSREGTRIASERMLAASPSVVFAFLADLENHWLLDDCFVAVLNLERPDLGGPATGGAVRIQGPLGLGRIAYTRIVKVEPPTTIAGTATVGRRTEALVRWTLRAVAEGTLVRLEATVVRASWIDVALLAAGGRRWLDRRFASILETLARRVPDAGQASSA